MRLTRQMSATRAIGLNTLDLSKQQRSRFPPVMDKYRLTTGYTWVLVRERKWAAYEQPGDDDSMAAVTACLKGVIVGLGKKSIVYVIPPFGRHVNRCTLPMATWGFNSASERIKLHLCIDAILLLPRNFSSPMLC